MEARRSDSAHLQPCPTADRSGTALLSERNGGGRLAPFLAREQSLEHEMTKHIVQSPNPDGSLLLRELNHRIRSELTSAIYAASSKAVQSDSVAVKDALLGVVDLLH